MKILTAQEVLEYIAELNQNNWWFIGQRKWRAALAYKVLEHETRLRNTTNSEKPAPDELGLVFLKDLSQVNEALISDCNRNYIFNQSTQIHIVPNEDAKDLYFLAETNNCCDEMALIPVINIKPAENQNRPHPFLFASLLGSISENLIQVKICRKHGTWRFYHE